MPWVYYQYQIWTLIPTVLGKYMYYTVVFMNNSFYLNTVVHITLNLFWQPLNFWKLSFLSYFQGFLSLPGNKIQSVIRL